MSKKTINEKYYEQSDFSNLINTSSQKKYVSAKTKRVTMNISENAFEEAHEIDKFLNMGYQNVLKTAIMLGLNDLYAQVNQKRK